jgi:hypothetical protein
MSSCTSCASSSPPPAHPPAHPSSSIIFIKRSAASFFPFTVAGLMGVLNNLLLAFLFHPAGLGPGFVEAFRAGSAGRPGTRLVVDACAFAAAFFCDAICDDDGEAFDFVVFVEGFQGALTVTRLDLETEIHEVLKRGWRA